MPWRSTATGGARPPSPVHRVAHAPCGRCWCALRALLGPRSTSLCGAMPHRNIWNLVRVSSHRLSRVVSGSFALFVPNILWHVGPHRGLEPAVRCAPRWAGCAGRWTSRPLRSPSRTGTRRTLESLVVPWSRHLDWASPLDRLGSLTYHSLPWDPEPLAPGTPACRPEGLSVRPAPSWTG